MPSTESSAVLSGPGIHDRRLRAVLRRHPDIEAFAARSRPPLVVRDPLTPTGRKSGGDAPPLPRLHRCVHARGGVYPRPRSGFSNTLCFEMNPDRLLPFGRNAVAEGPVRRHPPPHFLNGRTKALFSIGCGVSDKAAFVFDRRAVSRDHPKQNVLKVSWRLRPHDVGRVGGLVRPMSWRC